MATCIHSRRRVSGSRWTRIFWQSIRRSKVRDTCRRVRRNAGSKSRNPSGMKSSPSHRSRYRIFRSITTRWMDNDVYGHLNNVVHYSLFDTAVSGWLLEQDLIHPHQGEQIGLVVETGCRYFAELAFPDLVTAGMRVAKLGTSSVRYEIGLFRNDDETAAAEGFFVHVYVDRATRRPQPLHQRLRQSLAQQLLVEVAPAGEK